MPLTLEDLETSPLVIHLHPVLQMTADQFFEFCVLNRDLQIERTAQGDILIMSPEGWETGGRDAELTAQLRVWAKRDGTGVASGSSTGFVLPNGATRSPDAAWVLKTRLGHLTRKQKEKFLPLCPDFVVELRSPTDRLARLKEKMEEYRENGARLGWLIDPVERKVYVYRPNGEVEIADNPQTVSGDPVLPGFVLELGEIWEPAL